MKASIFHERSLLLPFLIHKVSLIILTIWSKYRSRYTKISKIWSRSNRSFKPTIFFAAMMSFLLDFVKIESHRFYDKPSYCRSHIYSQMFEIIKQFGRD